jgi:transaldolase
MICDIMDIFKEQGIETQIIAAGVRSPLHVNDCAKAGAGMAAVPYSVLFR